jgi:hypothetical protein
MIRQFTGKNSSCILVTLKLIVYTAILYNLWVTLQRGRLHSRGSCDPPPPNSRPVDQASPSSCLPPRVGRHSSLSTMCLPRLPPHRPLLRPLFPQLLPTAEAAPPSPHRPISHHRRLAAPPRPPTHRQSCTTVTSPPHLTPPSPRRPTSTTNTPPVVAGDEPPTLTRPLGVLE